MLKRLAGLRRELKGGGTLDCCPDVPETRWQKQQLPGRRSKGSPSGGNIPSPRGRISVIEEAENHTWASVKLNNKPHLPQRSRTGLSKGAPAQKDACLKAGSWYLAGGRGFRRAARDDNRIRVNTRVEAGDGPFHASSLSGRCCSCDFATTNMNSLKGHMRKHPQEHQAMQLLEQYR